MYRISVNTSLNHKRKSSKWGFLQRLENKFKSELSIPEHENPQNFLIQDEHRKWMKAALDSLPENQWTAIILSKYDDLSQKEIAEVMNMTEGAV